MSDPIVIDVIPDGEGNKVNVKGNNKLGKYKLLLGQELKKFVTLTLDWLVSTGKVFLYSLTLLGLSLQAFGKWKSEQDKKQPEAKNKLF